MAWGLAFGELADHVDYAGMLPNRYAPAELATVFYEREREIKEERRRGKVFKATGWADGKLSTKRRYLNNCGLVIEMGMIIGRCHQFLGKHLHGASDVGYSVNSDTLLDRSCSNFNARQMTIAHGGFSLTLSLNATWMKVTKDTVYWSRSTIGWGWHAPFYDELGAIHNLNILQFPVNYIDFTNIRVTRCHTLKMLKYKRVSDLQKPFIYATITLSRIVLSTSTQLCTAKYFHAHILEDIKWWNVNYNIPGISFRDEQTQFKETASLITFLVRTNLPIKESVETQNKTKCYRAMIV